MRLQMIEGLCEKISNSEKAVRKSQAELNSPHEMADMANKMVGEVEKGMEFENAELARKAEKERRRNCCDLYFQGSMLDIIYLLLFYVFCFMSLV